MESHDNAKSAIAEPQLSDLEQEQLRFAELTEEVEAARAELIDAKQEAANYKNERLRELEAHRDAVDQKYQLLLEKFADARERLRAKGIYCG